MRIIAIKALREFWERYPDAEQPLRAWYADAKSSTWESPLDITNTYAAASILPGNRVVFNIKGNRYRLIVHIHYKSGIVHIRFVGTHQEYDRIDAIEI